MSGFIYKTYIFEFRIGLHIDDLPLLEYINKTLGIGQVIKDQRAMCYYRVSKLKEIEEIIKIFDKFCLNSTKILNFLKFKEAFEIYINSKEKTIELAQTLENLKSEMNTKRTNFQLPEGHQYRITSY